MITGTTYLDAVATAGVVVVAVTLVPVGDPAAFAVLAEDTSDGAGAYSLDISPYTADVAVIAIPPALSEAQPLVQAPVSDGATVDFYLTDTDYVPPTGDNVDLTLSGLLLSTTGPTSQTVDENTTVNLTVTAQNGAAPYTYQWYADGVIVLGETADTLSFNAAVVDNGVVFTCEVTDDDGFTVVSNAATLTVNDLQPSITAEPADQQAYFGDTVVLIVGAESSGGTLTYQWYDASDDSPIPSETAAALTVTTLATVDMTGDAYYVIVTDDNGSEQSRTATITVDWAINDIREFHITPWSVADAGIDKSFVTSFLMRWSVFDAFTKNKESSLPCPLRAHRGLDENGHTYWIPFYDKSARCYRGPLTNDRYNRYYWTQDGQNARYAPLDVLELDGYTEGYELGVPAPINPPKLVASKEAYNEDAVLVTRAYVYTYVTLFGEEGPPSPPALASGAEGKSWVVAEMDTGPTDGARRRITSKRIYRTITVDGSADYHFVRQIPVKTESYDDQIFTSEIAGNVTLESETWAPPPANLEGLIAHPNGFFVGFTGRTLHFSEPYRPHAWPADYDLSVTGEIIGLGIYGTTIVVATDSHPYFATGITPGGMVLTMHDTAEPCLSRFGIVSMPFGVFYPSPNGLMLASPRGVENATRELLTREEWQNRYRAKHFDACKFENRYLAFYAPSKGVMFSPEEGAGALVEVDLRETGGEPDKQDSVFTDIYTGKVFLMDECRMHEWNPVSGPPLPYQWMSKEFDALDPLNFGAARIIWYALYTPPSEAQTQAWREWNDARMAAAPLNPLNYSALGTVRQESVPGFESFPQIKQPFHWSPMIWIPYEGEDWPNTPFVVLDVIANDKVVYSKNITHTKMFRLPHGFKATRWKFRLRSNIHIKSVKVAETGKELAHI